MNKAEKPQRKLKNTEGISPVITTIIISATLLIILVIASFVSTNILELQVASTEFEQAKTNMLLLDEVIQDVALRPGAGGYVQFNQRSGGINIINSPETLKLLGPLTGTFNRPLPYSPTSNAGSWKNPEGAYALDTDYANSTSADEKHRFGGFNFNIPEPANITMVTVIVNAYSSDRNNPDQIMLKVSVDGGSSYLPNSEISNGITNSESTVRFNITSWTNWTPQILNNNQIWVNFTHYKKGGTDTLYLNSVAVEVEYASVAPELIYESLGLVSIFYRGGSKVSGADMRLRGAPQSIVNMEDSIGYLRVETGSGIQIKLDYNRVRATNLGVQVGGGRLTNVTVITFYQLTRGRTGGAETVNVKVQNMFNINPIIREYNTNNLTLRIQLGNNQPETVNLTSEDPAVTTTVILKVIEIQVSTA